MWQETGAQGQALSSPCLADPAGREGDRTGLGSKCAQSSWAAGPCLAMAAVPRPCSDLTLAHPPALSPHSARGWWPARFSAPWNPVWEWRGQAWAWTWSSGRQSTCVGWMAPGANGIVCRFGTADPGKHGKQIRCQVNWGPSLPRGNSTLFQGGLGKAAFHAWLHLSEGGLRHPPPETSLRGWSLGSARDTGHEGGGEAEPPPAQTPEKT